MSKREGPRSSTIGATIEAPKTPRGRVPLGAVSLPEKIEFRSQMFDFWSSGAFWALIPVQ